MSKLNPGDQAPPFALKDQEGKLVSLAAFHGKKLLLYFYPKADTPGCTKQACSVRDARQDLADLGLAVVGVSPDDPGRQKKFDGKYGLGFPLLAGNQVGPPTGPLQDCPPGMRVTPDFRLTA